MFGKRIPLTTQLVSAVGGRRALGGPQRFSPLSGATSSTHGVLQVRAASSKKKDKAGGKKKKTGAPRKSRYGPGGAPQTSGTSAPAKPLREDLDMSELRIDALPDAKKRVKYDKTAALAKLVEALIAQSAACEKALEVCRKLAEHLGAACEKALDKELLNQSVSHGLFHAHVRL